MEVDRNVAGTPVSETIKALLEMFEGITGQYELLVKDIPNEALANSRASMGLAKRISAARDTLYSLVEAMVEHTKALNAHLSERRGYYEDARREVNRLERQLTRASQGTRIAGYRMPQGRWPDRVAREVREMMAEGWQPSGGLHVNPAPDGDGVIYVQNMVKIEEPI